MLENLSALAIVPKAKAIAARRLSHGDYLELMRKRSVIEVTAALQSHPYFKDSLKAVSYTHLRTKRKAVFVVSHGTHCLQHSVYAHQSARIANGFRS